MKRKSKIFILLFFLSIFLMSFVWDGTNYEKKARSYSKGDFNILVIPKGSMRFGVSKKKPVNSDFYINSNFFSKSNRPIGLVVIKGKRINNRVAGGGYFYVKNGIPYVKAKSCPSGVEYSSQTILWGIDNGIKNKRLFRTRNGQERVYRTIMGENSKGEIMVISSNRTGLVTIKEIVDFAYNEGMVEGILLDGGSSVDYKFNDGNRKTILQSVPFGLKSILDIGEPTTYIYGNFN